MSIKYHTLILCMFASSSVMFAEDRNTLSSSGGKATSANYRNEATVGDIVGTSTGAGASMTLKSGFTRPDLWRKTFFCPHSPVCLLSNPSKHRS